MYVPVLVSILILSPLFTNNGAVPIGEKNTDYRYKNTWTLSGGVDYYYCKNLTFRFGGAWDQRPNNGSSRRTIRIPDSDRPEMFKPQTIKPLYVKENPRAATAGSEISANTENCESVFYGRVTPGEFDFFEIKE